MIHDGYWSAHFRLIDQVLSLFHQCTISTLNQLAHQQGNLLRSLILLITLSCILNNKIEQQNLHQVPYRHQLFVSLLLLFHHHQGSLHTIHNTLKPVRVRSHLLRVLHLHLRWLLHRSWQWFLLHSLVRLSMFGNNKALHRLMLNQLNHFHLLRLPLPVK